MIAVAAWLLAIIVCWAAGWITQRWCEWILGIAAIAIVAYPFIVSRLKSD